MKIIKITLIILLLNIYGFVFSDGNEGEAQRFTISGSISDKETGEKLTGATIFVVELNNGTMSNEYGFYSLSLTPGSYTLVFNYIGYNKTTLKIDLDKDKRMNIKLEGNVSTLNEVEITAQNKNENVRSSEMSVVKMDIKTVNKIPAFMGEVDILKTIQLLPGVISGGEGSTGYSVRGGSSDQNLILMDDASVFNASHLLGFFSVFNNDAVKDLKLYKGDIPAAYGGRLSSLLDVRQKDGNNRKLGATGGIGLISSRLMIEGPIVKDKASFLVAARRSYADMFLPLAKNKELQNNTLYFYDMNFKVNAEINENNRIFASGYLGKDVFELKSPVDGAGFGMDYGNNTFTLRWNHLFSQKLFSNFSIIRSDYNYSLGSDAEVQGFNWDSKMTNYSFKNDYGYYLNPSNTIKFGVFVSYHHFLPGNIKGTEGSSLNAIKIPDSYALEYGGYIENEQKITSLLSLNYGLRFTVFSNIGPSTLFNFDDNYKFVDSTQIEKNKIYNTYSGFEPRLSATYILSEQSSIKASYSRTMQFVQLASNSTIGNPLSIWFPASPNVKPQFADQVATGYFQNFKDGMVETSIEVFYKKMYNQIDFKDHAQLIMNPMLEGDLRFGYGEAYGVELFLRKNVGKLTGWISYTLSRSMRYFDDINEGKPYLSPFDRPHDFSTVLSYDFTKRLNFSATWVYSSGAAATFPTGRFTYGNMIAPVYSDRNDYRLPDYHRLDIGVTLKEKEKENKKWHHSWVFSVYNAYNRHNTYSIRFQPSETVANQTVAIQTYLFGIIPSITFNFNF
jgi:hypothetical protein